MVAPLMMRLLKSWNSFRRYNLKVDGKETTGMSLDEVVSKIRGPRWTQVQLNI